MIIKGKISSNCSAASCNIKQQKCYFGKLENLDKLHDGTINLDISPKEFNVIKTVYSYPKINWGPMTEDFDFIPIEKITHCSTNVESVSGYLYLPSRSPNRLGGKILEIWTEFIEGVKIGDTLEIVIPDGYLEVS